MYIYLFIYDDTYIYIYTNPAINFQKFKNEDILTKNKNGEVFYSHKMP